MTREINGAYSNYANMAAGCDTGSRAEKTARAKSDGKAYGSVAEYTKALQSKYSYMNTGTTSMEGVPTTVSVSGAFLKKCMNDPEKAKYLEENLAAIPDCVKSLVNYTKTMQGNPVCTYCTYIIEDDGNITCMSGCTNDPDGKIARENAERKAKEKKAEESKAQKRRAEKKAEEERLFKKRAEKREAGTVTLSAVGTDVKSLTKSLLSSAASGTYPGLAAVFDRRA